MLRVMCLAAPLIIGGAASAETFKPLPNATHMVDLDTGNGSFSVWEARDLSGANTLRARFRVNRTGTDKKWAPTFKFRLHDGDKWVGFVVLGLPGKTPLIPSVERSDGPKDKPELFLTFMQVGEVADLTLKWTQNGAVAINLRSPQSLSTSPTGETHTADLGKLPTKFSLIGSTGEIEVMSLELGTTSP